MKVLKEPFPVGKFHIAKARKGSVTGFTLKTAKVTEELGLELSAEYKDHKKGKNNILNGDLNFGSAPFWSRSFRKLSDQRKALNESFISHSNPQV